VTTQTGAAVASGGTAAPAPPVDAAEQRLVEQLRAGDETAFAELLDCYHNALLRLAMSYVSCRVVAEEVVQETWLAVVQGIDRFAGRSSLKTWIYSILMNQARRRGQREARSLPFSALASPNMEGDEPAVDPSRFLPAGAEWPGHWAAPPPSRGESPEERLLADETRALISQVIDGLPPNQRAVITLRDVQGLSSEEVRNILQVSDTNQRVLLHRARSKVRGALEQYLAGA
jgi:RNA polymerase sigma-70 factor (ECF subfamily)